MNYRELVLGMAGVHAHLLQNGRPVYGYEQHCLFKKRKSAPFLYSNLASSSYDRYVTDKVISGEFWDFPSSWSFFVTPIDVKPSRRRVIMERMGKQDLSHGRVTRTRIDTFSTNVIRV